MGKESAFCKNIISAEDHILISAVSADIIVCVCPCVSAAKNNSFFNLTILALIVIIDTDPWYQPCYAIPLLGMMLGNTMNGIAPGLDRLRK